MIDDGIWKTKRTCLIGSQRYDMQYVLDVEARAKRRAAAERPVKSKQRKLPKGLK